MIDTRIARTPLGIHTCPPREVLTHTRDLGKLGTRPTISNCQADRRVPPGQCHVAQMLSPFGRALLVQRETVQKISGPSEVCAALDQAVAQCHEARHVCA